MVMLATSYENLRLGDSLSSDLTSFRWSMSASSEDSLCAFVVDSTVSESRLMLLSMSRRSRIPSDKDCDIYVGGVRKFITTHAVSKPAT